MNPGKRQLLVDTVIFPPSKKRKRNADKSETGPQPTGTSEGTVPVPAEEKAREARRAYDQARNQSPERKEYNRLSEQKRRKRTKELGKCRDCNSPAIPGQTRCEKCAEAHRQSHKRSAARRKAAAKETETAHQADQVAGNGV